MTGMTIQYDRRRASLLSCVLYALGAPSRATTRAGIARIACQFGRGSMSPPPTLAEMKAVVEMDVVRYWLCGGGR